MLWPIGTNHLPVYALVMSLLLGGMGHVHAGPLSGPRQDTSEVLQQDSNPGIGEPKEDTNTPKAMGPKDPITSYIGALKTQVLPNIARPSLDGGDQINLDGLQGWSLDDIRAAMDAAALGLDQESTSQMPSQSQPSPLTVSVEDLYNFNTGYYFVVEGNGTGTSGDGDLVSGPNLPEIIGQTALSEIELDIATLSQSTPNLSIELGLGMLDSSFFTSSNSSSSRGQSLTGRGFRGGSDDARPGGARSSNRSEQGTSVAAFIEETIQFLRNNFVTIALLTLGFTGVGYVMSRFA